MLSNTFGSALSSTIDSFVLVIQSIGDSFDYLFNGITNLDGTTSNGFQDIGNGLLDLPSQIWDLFMEGLKALFIPSDLYFSNHFDILKNRFTGKFSADSYIRSLSDLEQVATTVQENQTITIMGSEVTIIDWSVYYRVKDYFDYLIRGCVFVYLIFYNYSQIYKLIRGSDYVSAGQTIGNAIKENNGQLRIGGK